MTEMANRRIAVAMSGGVDSSVAAALLVEKGEDVFGIMLRLWTASPDQPNRCCSPEDVSTARRIAAQLRIPFYVLDVQEKFKKEVVDLLIDGYANGITPNPCLACNRKIRWGFLLEKALALGATHLATGHYAHIENTNGTFHLHRSKDTIKDQSYVLSFLQQEQLAHAVFPIGHLTKPEVRDHAHRFELPVADRVESQDLCFVSHGDYKQFLQEQGASLPPPGPIYTDQGELIGQHPGLAGFTIGQRRGLGISSDIPLYVKEKKIRTNSLIVGPRHVLGRTEFICGPVNWALGNPPDPTSELSVQVRYRAKEIASTIKPLDRDFFQVALAEPLPDVTPGQAAVFYHGSECLGGGIIQL